MSASSLPGAAGEAAPGPGPFRGWLSRGPIVTAENLGGAARAPRHGGLHGLRRVRLRRALSLPPHPAPAPCVCPPAVSRAASPSGEASLIPGAGAPEVTSGPAGRALRLGLTFVAKRPWQHLALAGPGGCWLGATSRLDASIALTGDPTGAVTRGCSSREKGLHTALRSPPGAQRGLRGSEGRGPQWAPRSQPHACLPPRCPLW